MIPSYHILTLAGWLQFTLTPSRHERHTKTKVTPQTRVLVYPRKYFQRKLEHQAFAWFENLKSLWKKKTRTKTKTKTKEIKKQQCTSSPSVVYDAKETCKKRKRKKIKGAWKAGGANRRRVASCRNLYLDLRIWISFESRFAGGDVLAILSTGLKKSLIHQVFCLKLLSASTPNTSRLVISSFNNIIGQQIIYKLTELGLSADYLKEWKKTMHVRLDSCCSLESVNRT